MSQAPPWMRRMGDRVIEGERGIVPFWDSRRAVADFSFSQDDDPEGCADNGGIMPSGSSFHTMEGAPQVQRGGAGENPQRRELGSATMWRLCCRGAPAVSGPTCDFEFRMDASSRRSAVWSRDDGGSVDEDRGNAVAGGCQSGGEAGKRRAVSVSADAARKQAQLRRCGRNWGGVRRIGIQGIEMPDFVLCRKVKMV